MTLGWQLTSISRVSNTLFRNVNIATQIVWYGLPYPIFDRIESWVRSLMHLVNSSSFDLHIFLAVSSRPLWLSCIFESIAMDSHKVWWSTLTLLFCQPRVPRCIRSTQDLALCSAMPLTRTAPILQSNHEPHHWKLAALIQTLRHTDQI